MATIEEMDRAAREYLDAMKKKYLSKSSITESDQPHIDEREKDNRPDTAPPKNTEDGRETLIHTIIQDIEQSPISEPSSSKTFNPSNELIDLIENKLEEEKESVSPIGPSSPVKEEKSNTKKRETVESSESEQEKKPKRAPAQTQPKRRRKQTSVASLLPPISSAS